MGSFNGLVTLIGESTIVTWAVSHGASGKTPSPPFRIVACTTQTYAMNVKWLLIRIPIGLAEYSCFLATVAGLLLMRRREAKLSTRAAGHAPQIPVRSYHTWIGNPLIFTSVSAFLVLRAVVTDPLQGLAIVAVAASGVVAFHLRFGVGSLFGRSAIGVEQSPLGS